MERLTERDEDGNVYFKDRLGYMKCNHSKEIDRLAEYEDTGYEPSTIENLDNICREQSNSIIKTGLRNERWKKELQAYKDAEEQGLLVRLPIKLGTTIYYLSKISKSIYPIIVEEIVINKYTKVLLCTDGQEIDIEFIGEKIFLAQIEAEEVLKGSESL